MQHLLEHDIALEEDDEFEVFAIKGEHTLRITQHGRAVSGYLLRYICAARLDSDSDQRLWELRRDEDINKIIRQVMFRSSLSVRPYPNFPFGRRIHDGLES